jgi:hypothetical protein
MVCGNMPTVYELKNDAQDIHPTNLYSSMTQTESERLCLQRGLNP